MNPLNLRFLTVCLNPVMQRTLFFDDWRENEVNRTSDYYLHASGKGVNVTRVLHQLEDTVIHLTHAGGRDHEEYLRMCAADGLQLKWADSGSEIRTCTTVLNRKHSSSTELIEEARPVQGGIDSAVRLLFSELIKEADVLIISGTRAPGYSDDLYPWMCAEAGRLGKNRVLDIKGPDLMRSLEYTPEIIKPNLSEFCATFLPGLEAGEHDYSPALLERVRREMRGIHRERGIITLLTMGSRGVVAFDGEDFIEQPAKQLDPVNTIGCGDAFTAGFAHAWARGEGIPAALKLGTDCAAENARRIKPGVIRD